MNIKPILITFLLMSTSMAFSQIYPEKTTQQVAIGPYIGYESSAEAVVYGLEGLYEFRPFRRWGFIASATYDHSPYTSFERQSPGVLDFEKKRLGIPESAGNIKLKQGRLALAGGARFYIKRFFIAGGIGWTTTNFTWNDQETGDTASDDVQRFYRHYGVGYQLPLKSRQQLEFFFNAATGGVPVANGTSKVVAGVRYGLTSR
ncbi:hypothetical protein [Sphingobacterium haloxyli]|nr:hypothetical protein [Sphingobacterium haloxyli]